MVNNRFGETEVTAPDGAIVAPRHAWIRSKVFIDGVEFKGRLGQATQQVAQPIPEFDHLVQAIGPKLSSRFESGTEVFSSHTSLFWGELSLADSTFNGDITLEGQDANLNLDIGGFHNGSLEVLNEKSPANIIFRHPEELLASTGTTLSDDLILTLQPGLYGTDRFAETRFIEDREITLAPGNYGFSADRTRRMGSS